MQVTATLAGIRFVSTVVRRALRFNLVDVCSAATLLIGVCSTAAALLIGVFSAAATLLQRYSGHRTRQTTTVTQRFLIARRHLTATLLE